MAQDGLDFGLNNGLIAIYGSLTYHMLHVVLLFVCTVHFVVCRTTRPDHHPSRLSIYQLFVLLGSIEAVSSPCLLAGVWQQACAWAAQQ
jgi:hypothetical protein